MAKGSQQSLSRWTIPVALTVLVCLLACAFASFPARADAPPVIRTEEWGRLAALWQTMLDHSSNTVYNPELARALSTQLYSAEDDLSLLMERKDLPKAAADSLTDVFQMRYQYLMEFYYNPQSAASRRAFDASRNTARWVIEMQLAVIRKPIVSAEDEKLARAAEENIRFQLTYLHHMDGLAAEADQRRIAMKKREGAGKSVDWPQFEAEVVRQENRLMEAYQRHSLPEVRSVAEVLPYLVALTRYQPPVASSSEPWF